MKFPLYNQKGEGIGEIELPEGVFGVKINRDLIYQAAVTQIANRRFNVAHTKDRGEVRGGGKKPWRQKGTGRARHGSTRSPIWAGGGITFGPRNTQNFSKKINKKMKRAALFMGLSSKAKDGQMVVIDKLEVKEGKTKELVGTLKALEQKTSPKHTGKKFDLNALVVMPKKEELAKRSAYNIKQVKTILADSLNIVDLLSYKYLIIPQESIDIIKKTYDIR